MSTQTFKAIYFPDYKIVNPNSRGLILAFSEKDKEIYNAVSGLSSQEVRELLNTHSYLELEKIASKSNMSLSAYCVKRLKDELLNNNFKKEDSVIKPIHTTFRGGSKNPLHNWYSYLEGYSPEFVEYILDHFAPNATTVYDPFSGTGVTALVGAKRGLNSYYSEVNPLLQFIVKTKIAVSLLPIKKKEPIITNIKTLLKDLPSLIKKSEIDSELIETYNATFGKSKFFDDETFSLVLKSRTLVDNVSHASQLVSDILCVSIISALIPSSLLERAGDLRFKTDKEKLKRTDLIPQIVKNLTNILNDIEIIEPLPIKPILITENAKIIESVQEMDINAVITSPPYLNGTNYFRNTKVELWFLRSIKSQDDLSGFRRSTVTAGINDVSQKKQTQYITNDIELLCADLVKKAYDQRIPKMVADYFQDMHTIFNGLKKQLQSNAVVAIDIGDSIYSGVKVPTDTLLIKVLEKIGYKYKETIVLRKRISRNGEVLKQVLLIFAGPKKNKIKQTQSIPHWSKEWNKFKEEQPHKFEPFSKRNWGHSLHSVCSYGGKMKPSLAYFLVNTFTKPGDRMLDPFGGVGTIPFEGALNGVKSFSFDISPAAIAISKAKLGINSFEKTNEVISKLEKYIKTSKLSKQLKTEAQRFGYNKTLVEYYEDQTFEEIIRAREYFKINKPQTTDENLVFSSLLHILHGNRPYALSRRSHGITPFAPMGDFEYKSLIKSLKEKVNRNLSGELPDNFVPGEVLYQDATSWWPKHVDNLDAIITSPPFFDSTKFHLSNWIRLWFSGWEPNDFSTKPKNFVDEKQKIDFTVYEPILRQSRERLKKDGVLVFHLGKSSKCDMADKLTEISKKWFDTVDIFEESVEDAESHGVKDKGSVVKHQFLILK